MAIISIAIHTDKASNNNNNNNAQWWKTNGPLVSVSADVSIGGVIVNDGGGKEEEEQEILSHS